MINLNYRDNRPIYEQIKDGFRQLIVTGALSAGDKLPSVRELATSLAINPNTIQRAYRELETEGYINSAPGKGSFAAMTENAGADRREKLFERFDELISELICLGVTNDELYRKIENKNDKSNDGGAHK